ncbi:MAG: hypothetical protein IJ849_04220 [Selenomonadaceae bacterium]|nr:hypothetical protein [Selenomonadaceae bacterium]
MSDEKERAVTTDKESPTYAGLMLSLRAFRGRLVEKRHFVLNTKPREIDVRIIDNLSPEAGRMDNDIAYMFERHNLVELKNPNEPLNIDTFWKGISYAAQYKSCGYDDTLQKQGVNAIPAKDVTFTFLRLSKPQALLTKDLPTDGFSVTKKFPGVYYVTGLPSIKMQIVVGKELVGDAFVPIRAQKENSARADAEKLVAMMANTEQGTKDRELIEAVVRASAGANKQLYEKMRGELTGVYNALREIMKDDLEAAARNATQSVIDDAVSYMQQKGYEDAEIADFTNYLKSKTEAKVMV